MTITALHPSEIQFTCPPWCNSSREDHLVDLGHHEGRVTHNSVDRRGTGIAPAETWAVALSSVTYPDGTIADDEGVLVEIDAQCCHMTPRNVQDLVQALTAAALEAGR